jgi:hypothetical protein
LRATIGAPQQRAEFGSGERWGAGQAAKGEALAALPLVQHWQRLVDPQESAFSVDLPQGWRNVGGTVRRNALQFRDYVSATTPEGDTILAINDPEEWAYVVLAPFARCFSLRCPRFVCIKKPPVPQAFLAL